MPAPFGFGVGDFVAVGTLAWNVYKSCKAAPGSFDNISIEVLSLHAVLKEGEETLFTRPLPPARVERLKVIKDGCDKVLVDLQSLVEKYESLGTQTKRTWDRMRWGNEDIAEIRARLTSNITILTAFISTSQISVETKLDKFIEEFHQGKKEGSVVSLQTVDSLSADDRAVWRTIRKELEDIGISVAAFDANRNFIFDWFVSAVETGAFEEQNEYDSDEESSWNNEQESGSNDEQGGQDTGRQIERTEFESLGSINERKQLARPQSSKYAPDVEPNVSERGQTFASTRTAPRDRTRVPRIAALLAGLSRPRQRLIKAVESRDLAKALKVLKDEASFHLLDLETLDKALWSASCHVGGSDPCPLITELIARGANVNYISSDTRKRTPLWNSVKHESINIVRVLIENGADVNYKGSDRIWEDGTRREAYDFAPRASLTENIAILRLLLSSGADVNAQYPGYFRGHRGYARSDKISLIQEAASLGEVAAIDALLEFGAEIDAVSPRYGTALMLALLKRQEDAAQLLLVKGANANFKATSNVYYRTLESQSYQSPVEAAIIGGRLFMVKLLLNCGVVPDYSTVAFAKSKAWFRNGSNEGAESDEDREIVKMLEAGLPMLRPSKIKLFTS